MMMIVTLMLLLLAAGPGAAAPVVIDDFEDVSGWSAHPADGVELKIGSNDGSQGKALQLDFKFTGGGYAVARKTFDVDLPENYAFSFRVRGECLPNTLELKLIDDSGENVWWAVRRDITFPRSWETFTYRKRHISYAWGPLGGGELRHLAAIEFAVTAGSGGTGTVWIDELELRPLPPPGSTPPLVVASASHYALQDASRAVDGDTATAWVSKAQRHGAMGAEAMISLTLDLKEHREYGGLLLDWLPGQYAPDYDLQISDDGRTWTVVRSIREGNGGRDYLFLPETESRFIRILIQYSREYVVGLREVSIQPLEWSASRESFFRSIAQGVRRGLYPRGITGEQSYWTVVGVDGDTKECLFGEDGAIEVAKASFSVEPFLSLDGRLVTWADVEMEHRLGPGMMPSPSVRWARGNLELTTTATAVGKPGASSIVMRYALANRGSQPMNAALHLALRPFQVNPPEQFLNTRGGTAPIREMTFSGNAVVVNGDSRVVIPANGMTFGAARFDQGDIVGDYLDAGLPPPEAEVMDSFAAASGVLSQSIIMSPGETREWRLVLPLYPGSPEVAENLSPASSSPDDPVIDGLPADLVETLRAQLAYIRINRAGPAIQPGVRSYARSWIRDGSLTSSALLRTGHPEPVREFIDWFAPNQYLNGKIPCVVDYRGADPVPEHDSSGEFIFLIAEYYRFTHDGDFLSKYWPQVVRAAGYLDSLRLERRTAEYESTEKKHFYGILPPSISHEGYSAKPMHSYWDDFMALKGFNDAVYLAGEMKDEAARARLTTVRDEFTRDFGNSIVAAMALHKIDYIPGCADLGDFDATSTSIALSPAGASNVPEAALRRTFEIYHDSMVERVTKNDWDAYTPYEARNIGAFLRLDLPQYAWELIDFLLHDQRPQGWRVWAEVVAREERKPRFLGDMPHTWVGSDFIRSVLDMLVYEDNRDSTLVIGAGIKLEWLAGTGVSVKRLPTVYGQIEYSMREVDGGTEIRIAEGVRVPRGGIIVALPGVDARKARLEGKSAEIDASGRVVVRELPALLIFRN